jgi:homoserine O-succinyltransferase
MSGVFSHNMKVKDEPLIRGFDDVFNVPHSRHTEVRASDIIRNPRLHIISESNTAGVSIVTSEKARQVFVTGHLEYDAGTLAFEYERDTERGLNPHVPDNYFPQNNPQNDPVVSWRAHATLLFTNWLNYYVYQLTPYDINKVGKEGQ